MNGTEFYYTLLYWGARIPDDLKRRYRKEAKKYYDPLARSMRDGVWRAYYSEDNPDSWTEYTIMPDNGITDEEMKELVDDMWIEIRSMYDCTGKAFTQNIHWARTPAGIVLVHRKGIDV